MRRVLLVYLALSAQVAFAWDPFGVIEGSMPRQAPPESYEYGNVYESVGRVTTGRLRHDVELDGVGAGDVVMYSTPTCGYCTQARNHMRSRNIAFIEKDVSRNPAAASELRSLGGRGVPLILIGSQKMTGFSAARFDSLYASAAPSEAGRASTASLPGMPGDFAPGDILVNRIAKTSLLADARAGSAKVARLAKNEEMIFLGTQRDGYLRVKTAAAEGWIARQFVRR